MICIPVVRGIDEEVGCNPGTFLVRPFLLLGIEIEKGDLFPNLADVDSDGVEKDS